MDLLGNILMRATAYAIVASPRRSKCRFSNAPCIHRLHQAHTRAVRHRRCRTEGRDELGCFAFDAVGDGLKWREREVRVLTDLGDLSGMDDVGDALPELTSRDKVRYYATASELPINDEALLE